METILIHGDNESQIQQVILDWKKNFTKKYPNSTVEKYSNLEYSNILTLVQSQDMFSEKKLIILEDAIENLTKEDFEKIFQTESDDILVLLERKTIRKNLKIFKYLDKNHKIFNYNLKNFDLKKHITEELKRVNKTISPINLNLLTSKLQNQIQNTNQELNKLKLVNKTEIDKNDIESLIVSNLETSIFELTNNLFTNKNQYQKTLNQLQKENIEPIYIINMLIWQIKLIISIKANKTKHLNPYVVRNNNQIAKQVTNEQVHNIINQILRLEQNIKTGKIKSTNESFTTLQNLITN